MTMKPIYQAMLLTVIILFFALINGGEEVGSALDNSHTSFGAASLEGYRSLDVSPDIKDVTSRAVGVYGLNGEKIFLWESDKKWPIASITKLMTALVASDLIEREKSIYITAGALSVEGGPGGFSEGESFLMKDLFKPLLVASSNVAAEAMASHYGRERFVAAMNRYAGRLDMNDTLFIDPTGLSINNQSTVADLEKLVSFIYKTKPEIFDITRKKNIIISDARTGKTLQFVNTNLFASLPNFIGGKTGTIPEAVGNLISMFSIEALDSQGIVIILLGSENRFIETQKILNLYGRRS
ncbi:MAG TPA: serine hydrolase [Candidatus Paceibacterota bacterium]